MGTFLNLDLSNKIELKFLWKHLWFSFLWVVGLSLLIFRIDIILLNKLGNSLDWIRAAIPLFFLALVAITFFKIKWYYKIILFTYPFLIFFWFLPKTVLSKGKIYLFGSYVNSIYSRFKKFKLTIFKFFLFAASTLLFITVPYQWSRWQLLIVLAFFYLNYVIKFLIKSFRPPTLFGTEIESGFISMIKKPFDTEKSWIVKFVNQTGDEKLDILVKKEKQLTRLLMANYTLNLIKENINGFKGKQAFVISWVFESMIFLSYSILIFWFFNTQLYRIDNSNFSYSGNYVSFDFLYYTLKTMTFGDIEIVKPVSVLARVFEISSFFILGIFALVLLTSIVLSLKQDRVNENIKLATQVCEEQNKRVAEYMQNTFNTDIDSAMKEVKNINDSMKNLKNIIDKLF